MLETVKIILLSGMVLCLVWMLSRLIKGGISKKIMLWTWLPGIASLIFLSFIGKTYFDSLPINLYTVGVSTVLGVPGVILMFILKIFWGL